MSIIAVELPQTAKGGSRIRFSDEDLQAAAELVGNGQGASDGVEYPSRKNCQQVAWELRHGVAGVLEVDVETLTSRTIVNEGENGEPNTYSFKVYQKA